MELRQYWRMLVRRRKVVIYTFLIVLVVSAISVGYSVYTGLYQGSTEFLVQMQPSSITHPTSSEDPTQAAHANTDQVLQALGLYDASYTFFNKVSNALSAQGIHMDWKTVSASLNTFEPTQRSHAVVVQWNDSDPNRARTIVGVASQILRNWLTTEYQPRLLPTDPPVVTYVEDQPHTQRVSFTKSLSPFFLRAAIGLVAGIVLAYLFEYLDSTVQDEFDLQNWLGAPALGVIPGAGEAAARRARSA